MNTFNFLVKCQFVGSSVSLCESILIPMLKCVTSSSSYFNTPSQLSSPFAPNLFYNNSFLLNSKLFTRPPLKNYILRPAALGETV